MLLSSLCAWRPLTSYTEREEVYTAWKTKLARRGDADTSMWWEYRDVATVLGCGLGKQLSGLGYVERET